ncbi:uncharacterized protein VNE69_04133 [Vairimorpha necatrix]|uniref:Uncharacterized protein n=1 Tax=Vairimorpha necatrix TaxID=6039 RepID=A0AAX4JBN5_9MICR
MFENEESSESINKSEVNIINDPRKLWNKRDYYYKIDNLSAEKILKNFELKLVNENLDIEDAFYSSVGINKINEINNLKEDLYIKDCLECRKLREINFEYLDLSKINLLKIQEYIEKYRTCSDEDSKLIIKNIIKQKIKLDVLYYNLRNKIAEIIMKGEESYIFLEEVWSTVFRKSLELAAVSTSNSQDM